MKRRAVDPADDESLGPLQHRQRQPSQQQPAQNGQPQHALPEHALAQQNGQQNPHQQQNNGPNRQRQQQQRGGPFYGRRQPQTSCDSCRKRKLKCDRQQPCSSCVTRGLPCHGQPNAAGGAIEQSSDPSSTTDAILRRLHALEKAVFGSHQDQRDFKDNGDHGDYPQNGYRPDGHIQRDQTSQASSSDDTPPLTLSSTGGTTVETAGSAGTAGTAETAATVGPQEPELGHMATIPLGRFRNFKVGIATHRAGCPLAFLGTSVLETGVIWIMSRSAAANLLQDYLDHVYPLQPIIHGPTTRKLLGDFYDGLARRDRLAPHTAAFLLALAAVSAYFWQPDIGRHNYFAAVKEAVDASFIWRDWASDILVNTAQEPGTSTFEGVQAWALLSFLVQTAEGASHRFRFLHNCSLAAARELSLHLVDSPTKADPSNRAGDENPINCELKRRIWWHIAVTDWLLGFAGGPTEGTYSVQLRHMSVRYPKNVNDDELETLDDSVDVPLHRFTQMSYFLQRIRIGEIIRAVLDASSPGDADVNISDYNKVFAFDRLFEQALSDLPAFFRRQDRLPPRRPDMLDLQLVLLQLGLLSRRARLHRPFLLQQHGRHGGSGFHRNRSRNICLQSTRAVVSLGIDIIQRSLYVDQAPTETATTTTTMDNPVLNKTPGLSVHRLGLVISHLSAACTVLAIYTGSASSSKGRFTEGNGLENGEEDDDDQLNRTAMFHELAQACRVLGALGTESPVAADLLRNLVGLLNRYRVPPVQQGAAPMVNDKNGDGSGGGTRSSGAHLMKEEEREQQQQGLQQQHNHQHQHYQQQQQQIVPPSWTPANQMDDGGRFPLPIPDVIPQPGPPVILGGDGGPPPPFSLDGLWEGFTMGSSDDYTQLFANLDYYCGIA